VREMRRTRIREELTAGDDLDTGREVDEADQIGPVDVGRALSLAKAVLPTAEYEAFRLWLLEGLPQRVIAERLRRPHSTVGDWLKRAREDTVIPRLREELEE
jgi:DNA-directed RNA polymerase specialized sigma24 family protein